MEMFKYELITKKNKITMKIKIQFVADEDVTTIKDGKEVKEVKHYKDALQIKTFDGKRISSQDFGKNMANNLAMARIPVECQDDPVGWGLFQSKLYENDGNVIEVEDKFAKALSSFVSKTQTSILAFSVCEIIDLAVAKAVSEEKKEK
jgi:hypothetical protein